MPTTRERFAEILTRIGLGATLHKPADCTARPIVPAWTNMATSRPGAIRRWIARHESVAPNADISRISIVSPERASAATSEFVALLHPGDQLAPHALSAVARTLAAQPDADMLYSDEDEIDATGQRRRPRFKPDWSPDYLRSTNYIGGLLVLRRDLLQNLGTFQGEYNRVLQASEQARRIVHIPQILYHRRQPTDHGLSLAPAGPCHVGGARQPPVSVIIPNRDRAEMLERCLLSLAKSAYAHCEVLIVENGSREPATFALYERWQQHPNVRVLTWDRPFNYAAVNNFAAAQTGGELLLFLNNDIEAIRADWLERLVEFALLPGVGAVGGKLLYPDGTVQHAGVVVGMKGVAGHPYRFFRGDHPGYLGQLRVARNVAAVTGAVCLWRGRRLRRSAGSMKSLHWLSTTSICV